MKDGLKTHDHNQYELLRLERLYGELENERFEEHHLRLLAQAALMGLRAEINRLKEKVVNRAERNP